MADEVAPLPSALVPEEIPNEDQEDVSKPRGHGIISPMKNPPLVPDDLWEAIEPLLPKQLPKPQGGRPRVQDRAVLGGIIFVLRTGCPWRLLPRELGCGSGTTCWRRLRDWQTAGVWERLHTRLLNWLGDEAAIDWSRASLDSLSIRAKKGANTPAAIPRTAASRGRNIIWSSTATASPWPSVSRPPTPTIPPSCSPWSTPSRPSSARADDRADRGSVRPSCTRIRRTTRPRSAARCVPEASPRASPGAGSTPVNGWGGTAGWWSAASPGCWAVVGSACATSGGRTCSKGGCTWPAP
ncbi:MAG: hypothetical protein QOF73_4936 [Thermomicrobiales bacterium]|nr:hypothetical protein [Thermomicrobiales bacterium]